MPTEHRAEGQVCTYTTRVHAHAHTIFWIAGFAWVWFPPDVFLAVFSLCHGNAADWNNLHETTYHGQWAWCWSCVILPRWPPCMCTGRRPRAEQMLPAEPQSWGCAGELFPQPCGRLYAMWCQVVGGRLLHTVLWRACPRQWCIPLDGGWWLEELKDTKFKFHLKSMNVPFIYHSTTPAKWSHMDKKQNPDFSLSSSKGPLQLAFMSSFQKIILYRLNKLTNNQF